MARLNVNPTRMQLKTLKNRLNVATKGHKLLKDKCDEMIRRYSVMVKQNYSLRVEVENKLKELLSSFCLAKGYMSNTETISTYLMNSNSLFNFNFDEKSIMNISSPIIDLTKKETSFDLPYSYINTSAELDILGEKCANIVPDLISLATVEKTCQILSVEIEHTKRRVNALEFVMIPQLTETIKYISMKIEENDRASRIRLIKVKSMLENK